MSLHTRTLFNKATRKDQYNLRKVDWERRGELSSDRTQLYWKYLKSYARKWQGKSILDIGAGDGWLVHKALEHGAREALGIDPSKKNWELARKRYPNICFIKTALEAYQTKQRFDVVLAIMSLTHVAHVEDAFQKIASLLTAEGEVLIIIPDFAHYASSAEGCCIERQKIDDESFAVSITRSTSTIVDIVRKKFVYQRAAKVAHLKLVETVPILTPKESSQPRRHLMRLKRAVKG